MDSPRNPVRPPDRFLVFGRPFIGEEEIDEVVDSLRAAWIGTGPKVARFEEAFRRYKGASHAVAVNSCTAALHLSVVAAGIEPGDEVIAPALTFCASINAIIHAGGTPVLADVDPETMNLDPADVARRLTSRTRAIMPVHFAGRICDMENLEGLAREHGLVIIEDCAHAIESTYRGRPAGSFGQMSCFSFYATKNITTSEGGMILTADEAVAQRLKRLALHGLSADAWKRFSEQGYRHYLVEECGFKYNMTDLQAAVGIHQLARIDQWWQRRQQVWNHYMAALEDLPLTLPAPPESGSRHAYHLFTVLVDEERARLTRDELLDLMTAENIGVGVHYLALPEHPFYQRRFGWKPEDYPNATRIGRSTMSLPLSPGLSDEDVADVVRAVKKSLGNG